MIDLLDDYDSIPKLVKEVLSSYDQNKDDYKQCSKIESKLNQIGYLIDWGLDASFYNLRKA